MIFLHAADLHIGKTVNGFSLLEDQTHILDEILRLAKKHSVEALVLAGDIYDRATPGQDAVAVFDAFLTRAVEDGLSVLMIAGNHDSPQRLGFAGQILQSGGVYSYGPCGPTARTVTLGEGDAAVDFHLLPFVRPGMVRHFFPDETLTTHHEAVERVLNNTPLASGRRHVLVAHQFVVSGGQKPETSDSELISVGGAEEVDAALFGAFDYVALGHLHGPQWVGRETVRYAGSPLKYSFSERRHHKAVTLVEVTPAGVSFEQLPLTPLRDMRQIEGELEALIRPEVVALANAEDYLRVVLHDEDILPDAMGRLRRVYPNVMELAYDNTRTRATGSPGQSPGAAPEREDPLTLFARFYERQNGAALSDGQRQMLQKAAEEVDAP